MNHLHEMLKQKEQELGRLQKEIEALRLVVELVAEGHSKVVESANDVRRQAVAAIPGDATRNAPVASAAMSAAATAPNGGAKRFP